LYNLVEIYTIWGTCCLNLQANRCRQQFLPRLFTSG